jgi:aminopeptidase YwaD
MAGFHMKQSFGVSMAHVALTGMLGLIGPIGFLGGTPVRSLAASPAEIFDGRRAWQADSTLASPAFGERRSGSPGAKAAEGWIASRFAEAELRPAAPGGGFLQGFPVIGYEPRGASLDLLDGPFGEARFALGDDFTLMLTPAGGKVTAEAVFVGYGIDAPAKGRCDYDGCDLHGKIAVIIRGRPADGQNWDREFMRTHTFAAARAHGAVAVLYFQDPQPVAGAALAPEVYDPATPAGYVSERIVRLLLRGTGFNLKEVREKLAKGPFPLATGRHLRFEVKVSGAATATGHNVLAMLPGNDPVLGDEVVIFGAHHDHLGRDADGHLYPGADDNASGASVVVEMARAAHAAGWQPRRTVLFATFGGEELGLLGSRYLAGHLPVDSTRVVAMVNLDMAGQGDGGLGVAGGARLGPAYFAWRAGLGAERATTLREGRLSGEHSDYAPFMLRGIPALGCWSTGEHQRYHDIEDFPRYVRPEVLGPVGKDLASLLVAIADYRGDLRDGLGRERGLRADAVQLDLAPLGAETLLDPQRSALGGEEGLAGRVVLCDRGGAGTDDVLRRLGALTALPTGRSWLSVASNLDQVGTAGDQLHVALLPLVDTATLDRVGAEETRALCAAGLAGARWTPGSAAPSSGVCDALADAKRLLVDEGNPDWARTLSAHRNLHMLVHWSGAETSLPDPPDSTLRAQVLLALRVEGPGDSATVRLARTRWGEQHLHLDVASTMGAGADDRENLHFYTWLRRENWSAESLDAMLGGNLRKF